MNKHVLIAYGSRYGCTEEVAMKVGEMLNNENIEVRLVDLRATKPTDWPPIKNFDGIMVGSSIKMGRWTKAAKRFLEHIDKELGIYKKVLGVFVCCGDAATKPSEARKRYIDGVMDKLTIDADIQNAFGPVFDFSQTTKMGHFEKKMLLGMAEEKGLPIDEHSRNDLRDWEQIRKFATVFAKLVRER